MIDTARTDFTLEELRKQELKHWAKHQKTNDYVNEQMYGYAVIAWYNYLDKIFSELRKRHDSRN